MRRARPTNSTAVIAVRQIDQAIPLAKVSEYQEQCALFQWAALNETRYPALRLMFAIPLGGHRHKATAARLKASGAKAGVPDIFLPCARGGQFGLWIELKVGRNKPTPVQTAWQLALLLEGYQAKTCYGWEAARDAIVEYLESDTFKGCPSK